MDLQGKRLLVLGGIKMAGDIVKQAQKQGVCVCITDYLAESPAKSIADKSFMVSTTDVDAVVELIKQENIDGVLTGFIDSLLPYYQAICEKARLPCYGTREQFAITTNKEKFKQHCRAFNIPVVPDFLITQPISLEEITALPYPVLVKPTDYSGARGVFICYTPQDLMANYDRSLPYSPSKHLLVEKYLTGKELHLHYLVQDGELSLAAVADRHMSKGKAGILPLPLAYTYPSKHLTNYRKRLEPQVIEMLAALGIQNGLILIQAFIEEDRIVFYEMAYRLNGTLEYKIISKLNSVNALELMINYALSGSMADRRIKPLINPGYPGFGFGLAFLAKPGKIGKIQGIQQVEALKGVIDVVPLYAEGDEIPASAIGTLSQVIIRVSGTANTKQAMAELINNINSTIKVYSENGENMLLDGFDTAELFN